MRICSATTDSVSVTVIPPTEWIDCESMTMVPVDTSAPCRLCPRDCGVSRVDGQRGACCAPYELMVSRAALHHWEEPPISGEAGSGTVFFSHCPLSCVYCQNRSISHGGKGRIISTEDLVALYLDLQRQGALNINLVTPTHYADAIRTSIGEARKHGLDLPILWNTSGYEKVGCIEANTGFIDAYLTDFKYADPLLGWTLSGIPDYPAVALSALDAMVERAGEPRFDEHRGERRLVGGVVVRHLLLPGFLEDSKRVIELLSARYGDSIALSLMNQYTPVIVTAAAIGERRASRVLTRYPDLGRKVSSAEYEALLDHADELGVSDYFWQDGETASESFIPDFQLDGLSALS